MSVWFGHNSQQGLVFSCVRTSHRYSFPTHAHDLFTYQVRKKKTSAKLCCGYLFMGTKQPRPQTTEIEERPGHIRCPLPLRRGSQPPLGVSRRSSAFFPGQPHSVGAPNDRLRSEEHSSRIRTKLRVRVYNNPSLSRIRYFILLPWVGFWRSKKY